jgi:hypothetical protein
MQSSISGNELSLKGKCFTRIAATIDFSADVLDFSIKRSAKIAYLKDSGIQIHTLYPDSAISYLIAFCNTVVADLDGPPDAVEDASEDVDFDYFVELVKRS